MGLSVSAAELVDTSDQILTNSTGLLALVKVKLTQVRIIPSQQGLIVSFKTGWLRLPAHLRLFNACSYSG